MSGIEIANRWLPFEKMPMHPLRRHDVAIIGAGPAGGFLGYVLAQKGLDVLIVEKEAFPRYKPCGGGLTPRAVRLLPFDFSSVIEDRADRAKVGHGNKILFDRSFPNPIVSLVMRDIFDDFMIEQARRAGAVFKPETAFQGIDGKAGDLRVDTTRGAYGARLIVGADGVNSRVARKLRLATGGRRMLAVESEIYPRHAGLLETYRGRVDFDFGSIPGGYGWVFPKKNHLSVGVLTVSEKVKSLKARLFTYLETKGMGKDVEVKMLKAAAIRCSGGRKSRFANSLGMVVGDAAGLADPITGEGIYASLYQAQIAADVIFDYFNKRIPSITRYDNMLRLTFQAEMIRAERMSTLLYRYPRLSRTMLQMKGQAIFDGFIPVVTGHKTYRQQFNWRRLAAKLCALPLSLLKYRR